MRPLCSRSWTPRGSQGYYFCGREAGHSGACINLVYGPMRPDDLFWEMTDGPAENAKQRAEEAKQRAKKGLPVG